MRFFFDISTGYAPIIPVPDLDVRAVMNLELPKINLWDSYLVGVLFSTNFAYPIIFPRFGTIYFGFRLDSRFLACFPFRKYKETAFVVYSSYKGNSFVFYKGQASQKTRIEPKSKLNCPESRESNRMCKVSAKEHPRKVGYRIFTNSEKKVIFFIRCFKVTFRS